MEWLIFVGFAVFLVAAIFVGQYQAKKRRKDLFAWATPLQLSFSPHRDGGLENRYPGFSMLRQGSNRYGYNFIEGTWRTRPFHGFDYHYETYSTNSKGHRQTHHHHFSAVILGSSFPFKPLHIGRENVLTRLADALGFDDIDFESAEFSRQFRVKSPDRKWAYAVLHPRAMEFLMNGPDYAITLALNGAIAHRSSRFKPAQFGEAADLLSGLLDLMPDYLVREQQQSMPPPLPS